MTSRRLVLDGRVLDEGDVVDALRAKDKEITRLVVRQLTQDRRDGNGDSHALYAVSRSFRPAVRGWLRSKWFSSDAETVDEVWNDTLLRIYGRISTFDESKSQFGTWVVNQARYAALDELRRRPPMAHPPAERGVVEETPEPLTDRERAALRRAWRSLTRAERQLVHLRVVLHLPYSEIADDLGGELPEAHIRVYVARALKRLTRFYEDELGK